LRGLVEDKDSLDSGRLDKCAALAVELQHFTQELRMEAQAAGLPEAKLSRALCTKLFPEAIAQRAEEEEVRRRAPFRRDRALTRLSISLGDIQEELGPESSSSSSAVVSTTKFAYLLDHTHRHQKAEENHHAPLDEQRPPPSEQELVHHSLAKSATQALIGTGGRSSQELRSLKRHLTEPSWRSEGPCGGALYICKHYSGPPDQIYNLDVKVGEGTFGTVRKAVHKQSGQLHVVKSIPKKLVPQAELWAEIEMMKQLDHPHIMRLYYTFEDALHVHIASELCAGGELFDAILGAEVLTESIASKLFKQCLNAVSYLHFNHICHRDLKPENFLLSKKGDLREVKVKLIDFGTAKRFDLAPMTTKVCTVCYVAPEVLKRNSDPYTEKIDVWSCGVMLYLMLSGTSPFYHENDREVLKLVKKGKYKFQPESTWSKISDRAQCLIRRMLCVKVPDRCAAVEALHDDWFEVTAATDCSEPVLIDMDMLHQMRTFVGHNKLKKVALQVIARAIDDDSMDQLRSIFLAADKDMSGSLTLNEMEAALKELNAPECVSLEMQRILSQMDMDGSGDINWTEFLASTMKAQTYLQEEVCRAAFHMLDRDGDGSISRSDIMSLVSDEDRRLEAGLGHLGSDQVDGIMESVDVDGDGTVTFEEFMHMMQVQDRFHAVTDCASCKRGDTAPSGHHL